MTAFYEAIFILYIKSTYSFNLALCSFFNSCFLLYPAPFESSHGVACLIRLRLLWLILFIRSERPGLVLSKIPFIPSIDLSILLYSGVILQRLKAGISISDVPKPKTIYFCHMGGQPIPGHLVVSGRY